MCVITAYGVQCLVTVCLGSGAEQQAVSPGRGILHEIQHPFSCCYLPAVIAASSIIS